MKILIKPIITEKATEDSELNNRFAFYVDRRANKIQIKEAVESSYGVSVDKVRTMNIKPTVKTKYTKTGMVSGTTDSLKKAIVQISEGDTIDLYSNL
jgi:large subunit ribosomal protein L23